MEREIQSPESIAEIFSIFHDGTIEKLDQQNHYLCVTIGIEYLAQMISSKLESFFVSLRYADHLEFQAFTIDPSSDPITIKDIETILRLDLEIGSCTHRDGNIEVYCHCSHDTGYLGGLLRFSCRSATVSDQHMKQYSLAELTSLSNLYWEKWATQAQK